MIRSPAKNAAGWLAGRSRINFQAARSRSALAFVLASVGGFGRPAPAGPPPETILTRTDFPGPDCPPGWRQTGEPWIFDQGAIAPKHGGYGTLLAYDAGGPGLSSLDQVTITASIELHSSRPIFALCTQGTYGTIAEVDGSKGVLRYYQSWAGGVPDRILSEVTIPFALIDGHSYSVILAKSMSRIAGGAKHRYTFSLVDAAGQTSAVDIADFNGGVGPWPGHMWGAPGIMFRSGAIAVRQFCFSTPFPREPALWIGGDSFVEGDSIFSHKDRRFSQLLADDLGGRVVVSGAGGATSADLFARLPMDLAPFRPKYCLVLIGANDHDFAGWLGNLKQIIRSIEARGAKPILGTLAPRRDRQRFLNQANAWILSSGYRVVDFAAALTLGRDRKTWNPALGLPDGVHPNLAGHLAMFNQAKRDLSDVLRQERADPGL